MSNQTINSAPYALAEALNITSLEAVGKVFIIAILNALLNSLV